MQDRTDPETASMIREHLRGLDDQTLSLLRAEAASGTDQALMEIEMLLHERIWCGISKAIAELVQDPESSLEDAVTQIARFGHLDCSACVLKTEFQRLADLCHSSFEGNDSARVKTFKIAKVLGHDLGFVGNQNDYYSPENSYIVSVLDSRLGIPLTLSILYIIVGQRLGLPVHGVALPGHFIVGLFVRNRKPIYLDPFRRGIELSKLECVQLVEQCGYLYEDTHLQPVNTSLIIRRLLNHLYRSYASREDQRRLDGIRDLMRAAN